MIREIKWENYQCKTWLCLDEIINKINIKIIMDVEIEKDRNRPVRKNGLINGMNPYQLISWIYTIFDMIIGYFLIFQLDDIMKVKYNHTFQELFLIIMTIIVTLTIYFCLRATLINPIDPIVT